MLAPVNSSMPHVMACASCPLLHAVCDAQGLCTCWSNTTATQPPACYSPTIYHCPGGSSLQGGKEPSGQCTVTKTGSSPSPSPRPSPVPPSPSPLVSLTQQCCYLLRSCSMIYGSSSEVHLNASCMFPRMGRFLAMVMARQHAPWFVKAHVLPS